jgi:RNA polymerase sigma factor (sigma-70 family)
MSHDEQELIVRAQRGDSGAYESLVRQYEQIAFRVAWLLSRDESEAADAAQDAFVRAYRALSCFKPGRPFRPWLLRIVTTQALNRLTAAKRRFRMTERYAAHTLSSEPELSAEYSAERHERADRLAEAVRRLRPEEQTLIYLRYFLDLPEAEVAEILRTAVGTVKSRTHRTLARLRDIIRRDFPDLAELEVQ